MTIIVYKAGDSYGNSSGELSYSEIGRISNGKITSDPDGVLAGLVGDRVNLHDEGGLLRRWNGPRVYAVRADSNMGEADD